MEIPRIIELPNDPEQAFLLQEQYAQEVISDHQVSTKPTLVAGTDVSYGDTGKKAYAAIIVVDITTMEIVEEVTWIGVPEFPYRPGLFALREVPCLLKAFAKLQSIPDVILIDGNGILHPRFFGLACHIGLSLDIPTIGCAKSLLIGRHKSVLKQGDTADIRHNGKKLGTAFKTQAGESPIYISVGHKVDLAFATSLVTDLIESTKDPIPLHYAHNLSNSLYREDKKSEDEQKRQNKDIILEIIKELRKEGLSYSKIANQLNKNSEVKKLTSRKFTPRRIRNWIENL